MSKETDMSAEYELSKRGDEGFPLEYYLLDQFHSRYTMPYHWHMDYELVRVINGKLSIHVGNSHFEMTDGDCVIVPPGAIHGSLTPTGTYECVVFDISKLFLNGSPNLKALRDFWDARNEEPLFIKHDDPESLFTSSFFAAASNRSMTESARLLTTSGSLLTLLGGNYRSLPAPSPQQKEKTERIKNVISYIRKNYTSHVTLDDLSAAAGINREYLCREFKATIGLSPINFLIEYRVEQSKKILLSQGGSVTEAALASGFCDISYYIKKFIALNGCTPLQFKKSRSIK